MTKVSESSCGGHPKIADGHKARLSKVEKFLEHHAHNPLAGGNLLLDALTDKGRSREASNLTARLGRTLMLTLAPPAN